MLIASRLSDGGADLLAVQHPQDVLRLGQGEDDDGDLVVHGKAGRRGVHDGQAAGQDLVVADAVKLHRLGVFAGIVGVDPVDVLGKQDGVGVDLRRAQHRRRVRGEEGGAAAAGKEHHLARLHIFDGAAGVVALAHALDVHGGHDPGLRAQLPQHVADGQAVHAGGKHAHAVGADALDLAGAVLDAAPEVAAADDDADLHALLRRSLDGLADPGDKVEVKAGLLLAGQGLAADFDEYAMIAIFSSSLSS